MEREIREVTAKGHRAYFRRDTNILVHSSIPAQGPACMKEKGKADKEASGNAALLKERWRPSHQAGSRKTRLA